MQDTLRTMCNINFTFIDACILDTGYIIRTTCNMQFQVWMSLGDGSWPCVDYIIIMPLSWLFIFMS